jgi:hypothetical protein
VGCKVLCQGNVSPACCLTCVSSLSVGSVHGCFQSLGHPSPPTQLTALSSFRLDPANYQPNTPHCSTSALSNCTETSTQVLRRQNSGLSATGRRSSRLGGSSSRSRAITATGTAPAPICPSSAGQFEASRLGSHSLQQQQQQNSRRSSYESLGVCSPAPSLPDVGGLSRCGTPLSDASETPHCAPGQAHAGLGALPFGAFLASPYGAQSGAVGRVDGGVHTHSPLAMGSDSLQTAAVAAAPPAGRSGSGSSSTNCTLQQQAVLLSLSTWGNTPMGEQQYSLPPSLQGSPASRPSSPAVAVREGDVGIHLAVAAVAAANTAAAEHHLAWLNSGSGSSSRRASSSGVTAVGQQWKASQQHLQRCVSASGALTRSTSCGSSMGAAAAPTRLAASTSLQGVVGADAAVPHPASVSVHHTVTRSMSGTMSPAMLAAAAAGSSSGQQQQLGAAGVGVAAGGVGCVDSQGVGSAVVSDWLKLQQKPAASAHLMWKQPHGRLRPLPGHRTHYHSDSDIQVPCWPVAAAAPAAAAAAGSSAASLAQPPAAAAAVAAAEGRTASPGLEVVAAALAPSIGVEASLLALQTKTIKCSMCGVSGGL